jgi:dipeptidyl aminopeptidase/acylaminoacyl peptidase
MHGTADGVAPTAQSTRFHVQAQRLGLQSELKLLEGANHEGPQFDTPETTGQIADFLHRALPAASSADRDLQPTATKE